MKSPKYTRKIRFKGRSIAITMICVATIAQCVHSTCAQEVATPYAVVGVIKGTYAPQQVSRWMPRPLTPAAAAIPKINGPSVFGVRPHAPFLYAISATGVRPMEFGAESMPEGLKINKLNGMMTGAISKPGDYQVTLIAKNRLGEARFHLKVVVGEQLALTPIMGWNSFPVWGNSRYDTDRTLQAAKKLVALGLDRHGWKYINLDDGWQGVRGGSNKALQPDLTAFPDMKKLCDDIHDLGLKIGIYSTPWVMSYAERCGGTSENSNGDWNPSVQWPGKSHPPNINKLPMAIGKYSFATQDARQFAEWGFDYLKYDWNPIQLPEVMTMHDALRKSGRDIILSLSNNHEDTLSKTIMEVAPHAESWRTSSDIRDTWESMSGIGFSQEKWSLFQRPGHYNDPDTLVVGWMGWGRKLRQTRLLADEQYTNMSLWCLLSAPLLIGCDLDRMDDFTMGLLTNDEVIAIDQDPLCKPASCVTPTGDLKVYVKPLADGTMAVGLFNTGTTLSSMSIRWKDLGLSGKQHVRDLWRQKDQGEFKEGYTSKVPPHGVKLLKISPAS